MTPAVAARFVNCKAKEFKRPMRSQTLALERNTVLRAFPRGCSFIPRNRSIVLGGVTERVNGTIPPELNRVVKLDVGTRYRAGEGCEGGG